jgi:hypothetical protein
VRTFDWLALVELAKMQGQSIKLVSYRQIDAGSQLKFTKTLKQNSDLDFAEI